MCDLSAVGNICAFCHTGIKAFFFTASVERGTEGELGRGNRRGSARWVHPRDKRGLKWIKWSFGKTFSFRPFAYFLSRPSSFCSCAADRASQPARQKAKEWPARIYFFLLRLRLYLACRVSVRARACMSEVGCYKKQVNFKSGVDSILDETSHFRPR